MPAGFHQPTSDLESIIGIQFGIFSPDEIVKRSVVEVISQATYDGNEPKIGGLFDPRMGVLDNGKTCRSCGQTNHGCPGHFGHYRLARPVYFIQFLPMIRNVLRCICIRCSKLLIDKNNHARIAKRRGESRWKAVLDACSKVSRCGQETEDGCGTVRPKTFQIEGIARIVAEWSMIPTAEEGEAPPAKDAPNKIVKQPLEVEYVLRLFRQILDEDVDFMGLSRYWCRPDWMICTVLPIPPPQVRPSVVQDNNQRSEDDLTHKLFEIIKSNKKLQEQINKNSNRNMIDELTTLLQYHVATLVDNKIPGVAPSAQRGGRPLKSLQQRIGSKEGRVRYNIQGKRVEQSARSVITGDPNISIAEVGVPMKIAMNLTRPEMVTVYNRDRLYKYIQNGADVFPGAKSIVRKDGRMISLKHVNTKELVLYNGDIVNRHLMDDDIILFNRQPTLHRMSMMGHRVRVLPYNTFRLNVTVTRPYNADFDGDEMNAHIPQSYEATVELQEIASVPMQIIRPRDAMPVIGVVQDALAGAYLATRPNNLFTRREFMNMMMKNKRFQDIPEPAAGGRYTGQQIIGTLFPPINISMENSRYDADPQDYNKVKIREGVFSQGVLDKGIFNKAGKGIVHTIFNDYGPSEAVDFMDGLQNVVEAYLIMKGFSVGISDLIADEDTRKRMEETIIDKKKEVDDMILQVHMDLFTNNSGKSNQEEFEAKAIGILNKATVDSGKFGVESLSDENRLMTMVRSGSKGDATNVAQMIACVGQQAPEGRRIPYGFTDRTLPHYKMFDDGAEARGFVEGSFLRGLTPQEFFFHAMSGREGLIDTAVKSVTGDTPILILEDGKARRVKIGDWIDSQLSIRTKEVEHFDDRNLELLQLTNSVFIPTADTDGKVTWGSITAITRHDPGDQLYEIKTLGGKSVIVTESKALLIWDSDSKTFQRMATPDVRPGHYVPVTMNLATPPVIYNSVNMANYLPKTEYLYGTDFHTAKVEVDKVMDGCEKIPSGWWKKHNGTLFTLPYDKKSLFTRTQIRSKTDNIVPGYIYPFTTNRSHSRIPDTFALTKNNGIFIGLFLAEGNVDIKSGYIQITNNSENIRQFVKDWFEDMRIEYIEQFKVNHIGGNTSSVRGFSTVLAKFLDCFVGHGANKKYVPNEAFTAPDDFIIGLLNGYFSGDGTLSNNSIEVGSASSELIDGISMLCTRLGVFGKVFKTQIISNNLGTEDILPTYRLSIRAQWATLLASKITFIDEEKEKKRLVLSCSSEHRNFSYHNDVILDEIVEINIVSVEKYPKVYDLTVPSTLNFGLANGLHVVDTADTGYTQRQLIKAMEDLMTQHDGTVRDASGKIVQFHYGEDGVNSTKIEGISLPLGKLAEDVLRKKFGLVEVDLGQVLVPGTERGDDAEAIEEFVENIVMDRKMLIEGVYGGGRSTSLFAPLSIERLLNNFKIKFNLDTGAQTALTPLKVLKDIESIINKTQSYNKIWCASLRFHLAPHKIILEERFTVEAWDALVLAIVLKNMKARAPPGELVGIVAAQSIGEPTTQMSIDRSTFIVLNSAKKSYSGPAGPYIDALLESKSSSIVSIGNNSVVLDLEEDIFILGVSDKEKTSWKRISQVSRHPANGGLVEVHTRTGRKTIATLSHSFLKRSVKGIVPVLGSDLKIGMRIPVATSISVVPNSITFVKQGKTTFTLDKDFGWVCGVYLADGCLSGNDVNISKIAPIVAVKLITFAKEHGSTFSERTRQGEYGPSKDNIVHSKDLKDFLLETFNQGSYKKKIGTVVYNAPLSFIRGLISGFFDGDGNVNVERQQIRASSRSKELLQGINRLLGYCSMFGVLSEESSIRIPDKIQYTLSIPRKYAKHYENVVGFNLPEKAAALKEVIDYIERDNIHSHMELIDKIPELGGVIARLGKLLQMPGQSRTYGRWLKKESIGRTTLMEYVEDFKEMIHVYVDPLVVDEVAENLEILESALDADVLWDEITDLVYLDDPKTFVYDFTVPGNDSFMVDDNILVHNTLNTFHQAGVSSKSAMTRGVPRLKELLKVTKNPKANSLTITLKPAFRDDKDRVREVVQDLELTLLRDIVLKSGIYYDPDDDSTIIEEDVNVIAFFKAMELRNGSGACGPIDGKKPEEEAVYSKWILRLQFDREKMFAKNITMDDVYFVIHNAYAHYGERDNNIQTIYSDYNSQKLVMRIRPKLEDNVYSDHLSSIKKFQNTLLNNTIIRGIHGIRAVTWRKDNSRVEEHDGKYEELTQYILDTDGTNFVAIMNHPAVDGDRLYSTNVHDIYEQLGIEATRVTLYSEINSLFGEADINYRHLGLLCDIMTHTGRLMSADRYGINKMDSGPLAKACFEETEKILLKAALFGEMDPVTGVSANIMTGQPIRAGTGFTQILLDEAALPGLMKDLQPLDEEEEEVEMPDQNVLNAERFGDDENDYCSQLQTQMNMTLPVAGTQLEDEEEIEVVAI